jgi:hypothetical protein
MVIKWLILFHEQLLRQFSLDKKITNPNFKNRKAGQNTHKNNFKVLVKMAIERPNTRNISAGLESKEVENHWTKG